MKYDELIRDQSTSIIETLLASLAGNAHVEVRFDYADDDQWAVIAMHEYEEDKEVSVRLHTNDFYDLCFGYYDDKDEFFELTKPLSKDEINMLPGALKKVMKKVLEDEKGMRVAGSLLLNKQS